MIKNEKGCWYAITVFECPLCGRATVYRERQRPPKPENWYDRHDRREVWDYCDAL